MNGWKVLTEESLETCEAASLLYGMTKRPISNKVEGEEKLLKIFLSPHMHLQ